MTKLDYYLQQVDDNKIPGHIAVIMDGNGRWAKSRGLPRIAGHRAGVETIRRVSEISSQLGVETLTLFAFSTENWRRPKKEVDFLLSLPKEYLKKELKNLQKNNTKITAMGDFTDIPEETVNVIEQGIAETKNNSSLNLNFALNYGGRTEIAHAIQELAKKVQKQELDPEDIDQDSITQHLYNPDLPDPDLLIRSSGEQRISNFLLWQLAYTELWFTEVYWPDFSQEHFLQAIIDFQTRERKFGKV